MATFAVPEEASPRNIVSEALLCRSRMDMPVKYAWIINMIRSIADPERAGEPDDERLMPAVDAWLSFPQRRARAVDSTDAHGTTLLMIAACFGKVGVVKRLLAAGADPDRVNKSSRGAIVYAVMGPDLPEKKAQIVQILLDSGVVRGVGRALETAALLGREKLVRVLASAGGAPLMSPCDPRTDQRSLLADEPAQPWRAAHCMKEAVYHRPTSSTAR